MMQRTMFRRHFNQTISVEELQQLEQQKDLIRKEQQRRQDNIQNYQVLIKNYLASTSTKDETATNPLQNSRNMFSKHFFPKPCDNCYASRSANQQKVSAYELALQQHENTMKLTANKSILAIPNRPRQIPLVVDVTSADVA